MFLDIYPKDPQNFKKNELNTLQTLRTQPFFQQNFQQLYLDAEQEYFRNDSPRFQNFEFESHIDITIDQVLRRVYFGGKMIRDGRKQKYEEISYYLAICQSGCLPCQILRKFHFDCAVPGILRNKVVPLFHLQYAGELTPYLTKDGFNLNNMESGFSEPRIIHFPITLALLLNMIFVEAEDEKIKTYLLDEIWLNLVRKNEEFILFKYYEKCGNLIKLSKRNNSSFILDHCYAA